MSERLTQPDGRTCTERTAALFNLVHVPFAHDADEQSAWLDYTTSVWDDDEHSITLLKQYFGHVPSREKLKCRIPGLDGRSEEQAAMLWLAR